MGFISGSLRYYVPAVSEGDLGGGVVSFENVQNVRGAEVLRPSIRILFKIVKPYYKANPCFLLIAEKMRVALCQQQTIELFQRNKCS